MGLGASTGGDAGRPPFYFVGDSLTEFGSYPQDGGFIALLQRDDVRSIDMINRGLAGFKLAHVLPTLEDELETRFEPSLVARWLGANDAVLPDGRARSQHVPLAEYRAHLATIVGALSPLLASRGRFLFITPPPVIDAQRQERERSDASVAAYARACVEVSIAEGVDVLDLHAHFTASFSDERERASFSDERERASFFSDGLHLSPRGQTEVARLLDAKLRDVFGARELARFVTAQF
ncbi:hypothetical protein PybrP1_001345 [[Pythium] brassicae (nom. inval.)]|nr:hypothetical protein PybrP1_001345 [[Pythium] brassicae (nom. inval.)]